MDSQHQPSNDQDNSQPFRGDYPFHAAPTDQYSYQPPELENSFDNLWGNGRYTPESQEPVNAFNHAHQNWGSGTLQNSSYGTPNFNAMQRPYDQTFSLRPADNFEMPPAFGSHAQQNPATSAFEARTNPYVQAPLNTNSHFRYPEQGGYQGPSAQNQTVSPQALQHYPTPNAQVVIQKARQVGQFSRTSN